MKQSIVYRLLFITSVPEEYLSVRIILRTKYNVQLLSHGSIAMGSNLTPEQLAKVVDSVTAEGEAAHPPLSPADAVTRLSSLNHHQIDKLFHRIADAMVKAAQ
jgi:hypothetical protein